MTDNIRLKELESHHRKLTTRVSYFMKLHIFIKWNIDILIRDKRIFRIIFFFFGFSLIITLLCINFSEIYEDTLMAI